MKRLLIGTMLLASAIVVPISTMAQVGISINIGLPPPIVFQEPPEVIVLPDTRGVYVVPDVDVELFFWNGFWWRLWEGRWYRSQYYDRGWGYYGYVPSFYYDVVISHIIWQRNGHFGSNYPGQYTSFCKFH